MKFTWYKVTWPEVNCSIIPRTRIVDLGCVNIRACNLFVNGPKFTIFFGFNAERMAVDQVCCQFFKIKLNTYCTNKRENEDYKHQREKQLSIRAFSQINLLALYQ